MKLLVRPQGLSALAPHFRPVIVHRSYATQNSLGTTPQSSYSRRKTVTSFNDDGQIPWHELSAGEKTARATQQTFNFGLIIAGIVMTGGVAYFLYQDVFSWDSKTAHFNRAVDRIRKDPQCTALLGDGRKITAHGEETMNKWRRARPIASSLKTDNRGNENMMIHFYVHGPLNRGVVNVQLVKPAGQSNFVYKYFSLDVPGHSRVWLENADPKPASGGAKKVKFFGVNWG